jgi:hypothetical protein
MGAQTRRLRINYWKKHADSHKMSTPAYSETELADVVTIKTFLASLDTALETPALFSMFLVYKTMCSDRVRRTRIEDYLDYIYPTWNDDIDAITARTPGRKLEFEEQGPRTMFAIRMTDC